MKNTLLHALTTVILFLMPNVNFAQAPDLGTASTFAVFTAVGAFNNIGEATYVLGDVGTNVGAFNAFPPGTVVGEIHVADPASAQAATDVDEAYSYLDGLTCGEVLGTTLGSGQILTPNIYCLGAASTINGELILDGQDDPDALFIFQIDGALSTTTLSSITLINEASLCNVYWQVNGAVELGVSSVFQGIIVANGAISFLEGATLYGQALSRAGAVSMSNNLVTIGMQPIATITAAGGNATICTGDSITLTASVTNGFGPFSYLWSPGGETDSSITVSPAGTTAYTVAVTAVNGCSDGLDTFTVTVNECECICTAPVITSIDSVCGNLSSMCWTSDSCAASYLLRWRVVPSTEWIYEEFTDTCREFTNHYPDVDEIQIASICLNGDTSAFSESVFWENYNVLQCPTPTGQTTTNVTATSADISWTPVDGADKYKIVYTGAGSKQAVPTSGTSLTLVNLQPNTTYKWKVRARCQYCDLNTWGVYSTFTSFTTSPLKQFTVDQQSASTLLVFPNPANVNFTVNFYVGYSSLQSYTLTVEDVVGHAVMSIEGKLNDGALLQDVSLANGISDGIYFITITTDGKQFRERLVVNND